MEKRILTRAEMKEKIKACKAAGKQVVFTNGCFDILHVGHVRYLQDARALGDVLVIGVNTDTSVQRLKGPTRPIVPQDERAEVLAALRCVDYVTLFDEQTPKALIASLQPDIHVKGGDYRVEDLPEAKVVLEYGGKVVILQLVDGRSTTNIVKRITTTSNNVTSD